MSHAQYNQVLSWDQPRHARSSTRIPARVADLLVQRLAAERISHDKVRLFGPDSPYPILKPPHEALRFVPEKLPPVEVENCKFVPPATDPRPTFSTVLAGWDWTHESVV